MRRLLAILLLAIATLIAWQAFTPKPTPATALTVYCAAGLKKPIEALALQFEQDTGTPISLQYGGTGTLLSQIQVAKTGDLFIAADDRSLADASKLSLIAETLPIAVQHPVIAVKKGNPKAITDLTTLQSSKFALANPDAASISKVTRKLLGDARWTTLASAATVMKPSVTEVAADITLGAIDAAIVWDSTVHQFKDLEAIEFPEGSGHRENASAAILTASTQAPLALQFARYLASPNKGAPTMQAHHFVPALGDPYTPKPELVLYSGGVNRPAIEKLVQQFADREGVDVTTVFNGCGILCATMKALDKTSGSKMPDAYYACDVCFVPPVADQFPEAVLLTETAIIIATPKGNPKKIATLADLAQPGLKLGVCNAEQSTLGFMTQAMLKSTNLLDSVMKNVVVQVPTADFLVNQMRAGALDAAIVYQVSIQQVAEHFDAIPLPKDIARAVQPFAVRKDSHHYHLSQRLLAYLRAHRSAFEDAGFIWKGESKPVPSSQLEIPAHLKGAGGS
ncbi:MAG: molybdate ABC transporter substrate-binding protein [Verrucomicrobiaceae bacterium]|nr:molybdate ABC transporter substrate-binding protein [Verrucomicrobiaceae bacterium]